jgi:ribonuclease BN (tRNA processing enzyme)
MNVRVLGCHGGSRQGRHLPGVLIDDEIFLEAGSASATLGLAAQLRVRHVLLSHAHLDHTSGLAYVVDNRLCCAASGGGGEPLSVWSISPVIDTLHTFYDETVEELASFDGRVRILRDGEIHVL